MNYEITDELARKIKNDIGRRRGFGKCFECGDRWNWKPANHFILYKSGSGMGPLCDECFDFLDFERIMEHCVALWLFWETCEGSRRDGSYTIEKFPFAYVAKDLARLKGKDETRIPSSSVR